MQSYLTHWNQAFGHLKPVELKASDLEDWQLEMSEKYRPAYIDNIRGTVKAMICTAQDNDLISEYVEKPFRVTKKLMKRGANRRERHLDHFEYRQILDDLLKHSRVIFMMGYYTGMRSGEILNLTWDKVDLERRLIRLGAKDTKESKAKSILTSISTNAT